MDNNQTDIKPSEVERFNDYYIQKFKTNLIQFFKYRI